MTHKSNLVLYFGGKNDRERFCAIEDYPNVAPRQALLHYVATVWHGRNDGHDFVFPLGDFRRHDLFRSLSAEFRAFVASGQVLPDRGLTLEETWLLNRILFGHVVCFLNSDMPAQPLGRIDKVHAKPAREIIADLKRVKLEYPFSIEVLVYDGAAVAHSIAGIGFTADGLIFVDSWPGRSLLCSENNSAGVSAIPIDSGLDEPGWHVHLSELERVFVAANVLLGLVPRELIATSP